MKDWKLKIRCGGERRTADDAALQKTTCTFEDAAGCPRCTKIEAAVNAILTAQRAVLDLFTG